MIKGVLFDYGGVVADGGRGVEIAKRLCRELNLDLEQVDSVGYPLLRQMTKGKLDTAGFWEELSKRVGRQFTEAERHIWDDWWGVDVYPDMLSVLNELRGHGYQIGLLSNVIPPTLENIKAGGGYSHFDFTVLSCEVGFAKPEPEMYQLALDKFDGLRPSEIVFIDDQEKCLPPAEALGFETILATSTEQIVTELKALGLSV